MAWRPSKHTSIEYHGPSLIEHRIAMRRGLAHAKLDAKAMKTAGILHQAKSAPRMQTEAARERARAQHANARADEARRAAAVSAALCSRVVMEEHPALRPLCDTLGLRQPSSAGESPL